MLISSCFFQIKGNQNDLSNVMKYRAQFQAFLRKIIDIFFKEGINKTIGVGDDVTSEYAPSNQLSASQRLSGSQQQRISRFGSDFRVDQMSIGTGGVGGVELFSMDSVLQDFLFRGRVEEKAQLDASWEVSIEQVKLYKRVGLGSFAEVFHGEWKGVKVAVKVLLPPSMGGSESSVSFLFT